MKTESRSFLTEIFQNPINRNLAIIFCATLVAAIFFVTVVILLIGQL